ncbi:monothiol glutaredoxin-S6-like [Amaranthus tricolor]|uniref:monothiol glutaredoxin-S6-like n=1 Tax=Amaranthus tricolor TaxID=29722 RepID=UPI002585977B|nr:monothiol glutaredoxin-S6-like [Amaranthus tricolor]
MDTLRPLVDEMPVVIFIKSQSDPVSHSMKQLFSSYGANPIVYVLNKLEKGQDVKYALQMMGQNPSNIPAIFIGGDFIGGANEVIGLQIRGELVHKLINAIAIWV